MTGESGAYVPSIALNDENTMPVLGLGVAELSDDETERAVATALEIGYRLIDTAAVYGNEAAVGRAIAASGIPRAELFVTTKVANADHGFNTAQDAVKVSLDKLGLDYVDLYLVHWPGGGATWAWPGMEAARARGYARAIGISNFNVDELDLLVAEASDAPVVDQVQFNPTAFRRTLLDACAERGVALEAYSPLGTGAVLGDPVVAGIADRLGRSPAQVLLRWCVQRGIPVVTKSTHRDRIAENARVFDFELSDRDLEDLDAIDRSGRTGEALERKWW